MPPANALSSLSAKEWEQLYERTPGHNRAETYQAEIDVGAIPAYCLALPHPAYPQPTSRAARTTKNVLVGRISDQALQTLQARVILPALARLNIMHEKHAPEAYRAMRQQPLLDEMRALPVELIDLVLTYVTALPLLYAPTPFAPPFLFSSLQLQCDGAFELLPSSGFDIERASKLLMGSGKWRVREIICMRQRICTPLGDKKDSFVLHTVIHSPTAVAGSFFHESATLVAGQPTEPERRHPSFLLEHPTIGCTNLMLAGHEYVTSLRATDDRTVRFKTNTNRRLDAGYPLATGGPPHSPSSASPSISSSSSSVIHAPYGFGLAALICTPVGNAKQLQAVWMDMRTPTGET